MAQEIKDKEFKFYAAYVDDMIKKVTHRHCHAASGFLNPAIQYKLSAYLNGKKGDFYFTFHGGAKETERNVLFVWNCDFGKDYDITETNEITVIKISGSGFSVLDHRDYMGAILNLGIEREVIGDIVVFDGYALVFVLSRMADFLCENLTRIGKDKVVCEITLLPPDFSAERKFETVEDTIASNRLDCVVAALINVSREKASTLIRSLAVSHNYTEVEELSANVREGDVVSVRGYGKFKIESISDLTRKGRIKLIAKKYV